MSLSVTTRAMTMLSRCYSELQRLGAFEERFEYLHLPAMVGQATFGFERWLNQQLYASKRWKSARDKVIIRDDACDLGMVGYPIGGKLIVHHINPVTQEMIERDDLLLYDPENLICVSHYTHLAIHFGDKSLLPELPVERRPGDTTLW